MVMKSFQDSREEIENILRSERVGWLGLAVDGEAYVVPLNYGYSNGRILFHCALHGKKLDMLRANPQVCFSVGRQAGAVERHEKGRVCHPDNDSVICHGVARVIEDLEERRLILTEFHRCIQPDAPELALEDTAKCAAVEIRMVEATARSERDSKCTFWEHHFE